MAPIKLLHSCLNCFNWRDTLSYLYKKYVCLWVCLNRCQQKIHHFKPCALQPHSPLPNWKSPWFQPLPGNGGRTETLLSLGLGAAGTTRGVPSSLLQAAAKFPSPAWELFGRIWSDSGTGLSAHLESCTQGEGRGCWQLLVPSPASASPLEVLSGFGGRGCLQSMGAEGS